LKMMEKVMELRQLTIFRAVAKMLNFTKAAASLNYVQSNVTAQIHALEEELGVPLFDRLGGKQVVLTDAGRQLLEYTERLLDLAEEAQTTVSMGGEPQGTLKIGATQTLCIYRLPLLLRTFRTRYPHVRLIFHPSPGSELRELVRTGNIDVAFVFEEAEREGGPGDEPLAREPVWVLSAPDHPLVGRQVVVPADFAEMDLLVSEAGCCYRGLFERILSRASVYPATTLEFGSIEAVKQCVMAGLGLTILPAVAVSAELSQGRLLKLPWMGPDLTVVAHMVWHKDKWLSPALDAFLCLAREMFATRGSDEIQS
jgi:DNA-binding transcriptional LysR family regulator